MNIETAKKCIEATSDFYKRTSESFSKTRKNAWAGWESLLEFCYVKSHFSSSTPISLLDLASGNFRFEKFMREKSQAIKTATCIDNCCELAQDSPAFCDFLECNIFEDLPKLSEKYDLSVSFGFFHHIPEYNMRLDLLKWLVENTKKGGIVAVSLWQFFNDRLKEKSERTTQLACQELGIVFEDDNDRFLGWQESEHIYRYCHNFSDQEIAELVADISKVACFKGRFLADGKRNNQNVYLILEKI